MATQGKLDVLILGSGGREHALLKACLRSPRVAKVRVAPGNGGMALEAECLDVDAANPAAVLELVRRTQSNFVIVGPEVPLAAGVVDALEAAGVPAYGPLAAGARLEASKAFSKDFMVRHKVPTAASETFRSLAPALEYVRKQPVPIVIKASGNRRLDLMFGKPKGNLRWVSLRVSGTAASPADDFEAKYDAAGRGATGDKPAEKVPSFEELTRPE